VAAQGVAKDRIYEFGAKDNFWQDGRHRALRPSSEIHYDMGVIASDQGHTDCEFGCDCWTVCRDLNLVFMQFDRDASGKLTPLPRRRLTRGRAGEGDVGAAGCVVSNYDTDLFTPLLQRRRS